MYGSGDFTVGVGAYVSKTDCRKISETSCAMTSSVWRAQSTLSGQYHLAQSKQHEQFNRAGRR